MKTIKTLGPVLIRKIDLNFKITLKNVLDSQATSKSQNLKKISFFQACTLILMFSGVVITPGYARSLFELSVGVNNQSVSLPTQEYSRIETLKDAFSQGDTLFRQINPAYSSTSVANITLNVRGLPVIASYTNTTNPTALNFTVDSLGIDETFTGATRADSNQQFLDFIKANGNSILSRLLQGFVSNTPIDPVAGNPNSIMAKMSQDDYRLGSGLNAGGEYNLLGTGLMAGYSEAGGFQTAFASVPLNYIYTLPNTSKPPTLLILDVPLRYVNIQGASVVEGSIGVGATIPVHNTWSFTPMFRFGVVGSLDLGSIQSVYSGTVTSKYDFYYDDLKLSLNNMIGYYQTGNLISNKLGDYDLQNVIFRNGLSLEGSLNFKMFDEPTSWELQFTDARVTGDKWFIDGFEEITATFGTRRRQARMDWQTLRIGAGLTLGKSFQGGQIMFTYRF